MPPVNLNSLWVRQRIAANYYVVMAYQGSWWIKGRTNETLNDNIKWNQQSLQGFFWTRSKGTYSASFLIISITKLSRRHVNLKRSCSSGSYCYRWEWGIAYWVLGLVSYDILRNFLFWDLHGRMSGFYLHGITALGFPSPISLRPFLEEV